jgi:hypothetical protein
MQRSDAEILKGSIVRFITRNSSGKYQKYLYFGFSVLIVSYEGKNKTDNTNIQQTG